MKYVIKTKDAFDKEYIYATDLCCNKLFIQKLGREYFISFAAKNHARVAKSRIIRKYSTKLEENRKYKSKLNKELAITYNTIQLTIDELEAKIKNMKIEKIS